MAEPKIIIFSQPGATQPRVFLSTMGGPELLNALAVHGGPYDIDVWELKVAESQTPNPWQGVYLTGPVRIETGEAMEQTLQNYTQHWDGLGKEQLEIECKRAIEFLNFQLKKQLNQIKEEETNPQVEVISPNPTS